MENIIKIY